MTTGIERQAVFRRIRHNRTYNQECLKLLFGIIYRDPDTALKKWERQVAQSGFDKTFKKQRRNPSYLGKPRGRGLLGLFTSNDREKSEHANAEFHKMARTWYGSVLEEEEVKRQEDFNKEQMTAQENQKIVDQARKSITSQLKKLRSSDNVTEQQDGKQM